jgi:hypothetical protein
MKAGCLTSFFIAAAVFSILVLVSGCASFDTARSVIAADGAKAADGVRETAEWTLCNGITVGAWRRAYAGNNDQAQGWAALCAQAGGLPQ